MHRPHLVIHVLKQSSKEWCQVSETPLSRSMKPCEDRILPEPLCPRKGEAGLVQGSGGWNGGSRLPNRVWVHSHQAERAGPSPSCPMAWASTVGCSKSFLKIRTKRESFFFYSPVHLLILNADPASMPFLINIPVTTFSSVFSSCCLLQREKKPYLKRCQSCLWWPQTSRILSLFSPRVLMARSPHLRLAPWSSWAIDRSPSAFDFISSHTRP